MKKILTFILMFATFSFANLFADLERGLNEGIGADKRGHFRMGVYQTVVYRDVLQFDSDQIILSNLALGIGKGVYDYYNGGTVDIMDLGWQLIGMGFIFGCEYIGDALEQEKADVRQ